MDTAWLQVAGRWRKKRVRVKTEEAQANAGIMLKWLHSAISDHAWCMALELDTWRLSLDGVALSVTNIAVRDAVDKQMIMPVRDKTGAYNDDPTASPKAP